LHVLSKHVLSEKLRVSIDGKTTNVILPFSSQLNTVATGINPGVANTFIGAPFAATTLGPTFSV